MGNNAEKVSNTSKQVPVSSELVKDNELSPVEADTKNLLSTPQPCLESPTEMETDNVPSSANTTKNVSIKFGKYDLLANV